MRMKSRLQALERKAGTPPKWQTVMVYQSLCETREQAMVRHFGSQGAPPDAHLIIVTLGTFGPEE